MSKINVQNDQSSVYSGLSGTLQFKAKVDLPTASFLAMLNASNMIESIDYSSYGGGTLYFSIKYASKKES